MPTSARNLTATIAMIFEEAGADLINVSGGMNGVGYGIAPASVLLALLAEVSVPAEYCSPFPFPGFPSVKVQLVHGFSSWRENASGYCRARRSRLNRGRNSPADCLSFRANEKGPTGFGGSPSAACKGGDYEKIVLMLIALSRSFSRYY